MLRHFKWNSQKIIESYFNDSDGVKKASGVCLNPKTASQKSGEIECQVCMDDVSVKNVFSLDCGHQTTCIPCWVDYMRDAVRTKECINLVCPAFKCNVIIPQPTWKKFLGAKYKKEYARYMRFCREHFIDVCHAFQSLVFILSSHNGDQNRKKK